MSQITPPDIGMRVRVVKQTTPHPILIQILFPVPVSSQPLIGIGAAITCAARTATAFEGQRFTNFRAVAATKSKSTRVSSSAHRIAPEEQSLRSWPDPVD